MKVLRKGTPRGDMQVILDISPWSKWWFRVSRTNPDTIGFPFRVINAQRNLQMRIAGFSLNPFCMFRLCIENLRAAAVTLPRYLAHLS